MSAILGPQRLRFFQLAMFKSIVTGFRAMKTLATPNTMPVAVTAASVPDLRPAFRAAFARELEQSGQELSSQICLRAAARGDADAAAIALKFHLLKEGAPIVNTPMLGVFSRASGLVSLEYLEKGLKWKLAGTAAATNIAALKDAYEEASIRKIGE